MIAVKEKNKYYVTEDQSKQTRIAKRFDNRLSAHRVIRFNTDFGPNTSGFEVIYDDLELAFKEETKWINQDSLSGRG